MGIENFKRWHWVLVGAVFGLVLAYVQLAIGTDTLVAGPQHKSMGQETFERALTEEPVRGNPVVENLRVYPDGNKYLVKLRYLGRDPKDPKNGRLRQYEDYVLTTSVPFAPLLDPANTVNVGIHPSFPDPRTGKTSSIVRVNFSPRNTSADFHGWTLAGNMSADPGKDAEVALALRPGSYVLKVQAPDASEAAIAQLAITFNGKPLAPLTVAPPPPPDNGIAAPTRGMYQTTIPADLFVASDKQTRQVLHLSRGSDPLLIHEIRLINPTYSVLDYLKERQATNKQIAFRFGWWAQPRAAYAIWTVGSILLIGGVWPTVITLLTGAGFGKPPRAEKEYDLSRFKGEPAPEPKPAPVMTQSDADKLAALEAELEAELKAGASPRSAEESREPVEQPIRTLTAAPATVPAPPPDAEQTRDFKAEGEFYPVVRNPLDKKIDTPADRQA